jgi:hypothetical protein
MSQEIIAQLVAALELMLAHSCVADAGSDMKDAEDHDAERKARAALAAAKSARAIAPREPSEATVRLNSLLAASKNIIGVIRHKQWERLDNKADCLEMSVKLVNAITAEQPAQKGWRPFATAIPDGKEIIVYRPDAGVFAAVYNENPDNGGDGNWFTVEGGDLTGDLPTHWQPFPAAPKGGE